MPPAGSRLVSVVVATYRRPAALDVVLAALADQTDRAFEVVVADDGSGPETARIVERWAETLPERVAHVRHGDDGFRRARILNLAALSARGDHLLFVDGDCVPRRGMIRAVRRAARPGWFLSTKRVLLGAAFTRTVLERRLPVWRWSALHWLVRGQGDGRRPGYFVPLRDRRRPWREGQPDFVPVDNGYGAFCCVSRSDFEAVGGWDMRFEGWGCEDTDLVVRLRRLGLRCGWPGPGATVLHLWHPDADVAGTSQFLRNEMLLRETRTSGRVGAVAGIGALDASGGR